jgi:hypothetical protein
MTSGFSRRALLVLLVAELAATAARMAAPTEAHPTKPWDHPHAVTGRAPNTIELHPILDFACFSG